MPRPTWFDWLTVVAIFLGPIFALSAQRVLDLAREKKKQRVALFMTLMSTRAAFLSPTHVQALNSIVVVFNKKSDLKIRDAWRRVLEHAITPAMTAQGTPTSGWFERYFDLKVDLFQAMAATVGYTFTADGPSATTSRSLRCHDLAVSVIGQPDRRKEQWRPKGPYETRRSAPGADALSVTRRS